MIKTLLIKNYAIIEDLEINFSEGLTIITGETGAGKSILLGALGLIMGDRADLKVFYNQNEKCTVEGIFDIRKYQLQPFFHENDLDYEDELVIRREISVSGKSRAFINDSPTTLELLRQVTSSLIDLHQQFDIQDIHHVSFQLRMLDALAGNQELLTTYQAHFQSFQNNKKRLSKLRDQQSQQERESDFVLFQLRELDTAKLTIGEQELLEQELVRLTNAEQIKRTLSAAVHALNDSEQSFISQLQQIDRTILGVSKFHEEIQKISEQLTGFTLELQEIAGQMEALAEDTELDPERIMEVQARLDLIYRLQKKHSCRTVGELLTLQETLHQQVQTFSDLGDEIQKLEQEIRNLETQLERLAGFLSDKRKGVVPGFEADIQGLLSQLAMTNARLEIQIRPVQELTTTGKDEVSFLFAANKGSRLQQIKEVASGGELSRLTLVTKSLVASAIPLPTLIFDEIDSGVSGDVAIKMGQILRKLSNKHQVVSITHSPQVASKADAHYFVYKYEMRDRTLTKVKLLDRSERVRALAVMLSQNPPSDAALENARELMENH